MPGACCSLAETLKDFTIRLYSQGEGLSRAVFEGGGRPRSPQARL